LIYQLKKLLNTNNSQGKKSVRWTKQTYLTIEMHAKKIHEMLLMSKNTTQTLHMVENSPSQEMQMMMMMILNSSFWMMDIVLNGKWPTDRVLRANYCNCTFDMNMWSIQLTMQRLIIKRLFCSVRRNTIICSKNRVTLHHHHLLSYRLACTVFGTCSYNIRYNFHHPHIYSIIFCLSIQILLKMKRRTCMFVC